MTEEIRFSKFIFSFYDGGFNVKYDAKNKDRIVVWAMLVLFLLCGVFMVAFMGIVEKEIPFIILGTLELISVTALVVLLCVVIPKREAKYCFEVNDAGIRENEHDADFFMKWSDIASWGYINDVPYKSLWGGWPQMCLYFSKVIETPWRMRKKFYMKPYGAGKNYCSTEETIVFGFFENHIPKEINDKMNSAILQYCDPEKEISEVWEKII